MLQSIFILDWSTIHHNIWTCWLYMYINFKLQVVFSILTYWNEVNVMQVVHLTMEKTSHYIQKWNADSESKTGTFFKMFFDVHILLFILKVWLSNIVC